MRTLLCAAALAWPGALLAQGFQLGPDPTFEWEGHMDYTATAATLIDCVGPACGGLAGNNCDGLASATAVMDVVPESDTLQVVYAQVRWAASTPPDADVDEAVTLVPPGGDPIAARADPDLTQAFQDVCDAQTAQLFQLTCGVELCAVGMYSTGADVTQALRDHREGGGTLNGEWAVRDVSISGGHSDDRQTAAAAAASQVVGAWSLFVVYEDGDNLPLRRIYYYQGFEALPGMDRRVRARGFLAPADPTVTLTYLVYEGDAPIQGDSLRVNGVDVQDGCNPNRNVFNGTINSGRADGSCLEGVDGVDLDTFTVEGAIDAGDEEAEIHYVVPRGDGLVTPGEVIFTDWLVLAFDHRLPSFESVKPQKEAQPPTGSSVEPGQRIDYVIIIENTGGDLANDVEVQDGIPEHTTYIAGSARVGNQAVADIGDGSPFEDGFDLSAFGGIGAFEPGERHVVAFSVQVDEGAPRGAEIRNVARIRARELEADEETDPVVHLVGDATDMRPPPPPRDMDPPDPDMAGAGVDVGADPDATGGGDLDAGRCPPGQRVDIRGDCEDAPDPDAGPMCMDDPVCGPGAQRVDGQCALICGEGLVWDTNCDACGRCRIATDMPCPERGAPGDAEDKGGSDAGCGCDGTGVGGIWLLMLPGLRRRRR